MRNNLTASSLKISTANLAKVAYVYIRQSSLLQVKQNFESTDLQYQLVDRAIALGWPRDRIHIIDEDLGKSGASTEGRLGFQRLLAEIGLAKVGLVVSLDASRFARNNSDWYQLLELCSLFNVLIADAEQLYDPQIYHDRLLLGLTGMMSEAELHHLKMRLQAGGRNKAARGELHIPLPVGLTRTRSGEVIQNPDEEVKERLKLVFEKFRELGNAKAVMRYFLKAGLLLPARRTLGPAPYDTVWHPADSTTILRILHTPAYAGAYVYGRNTIDPARRKTAKRGSGMTRLPIDQWPICIHNAYPSYISWEEYMTNQTKLLNNMNNFKKGRPGAVGKGAALLQGITYCGICGRKMRLRYSGRSGNYPVYECNADHATDQPVCQGVRALQVDREIEQIVLNALAPDHIVIALAAVEEIEKETKLLEHQWSLKRERAKYEAERARRQYNAVEPENRLVARSLEQIWEEKLRRMEELEQDFHQWQSQNQMVITQDDRAEILALGTNLPRLWNDQNTTAQDRKQIIRLVIKDVSLDQKREPGQISIKVNWQTGVSSQHWIRRKVSDYENYADLDKLEERVRQLRAAGKKDSDIANQLNEEGFVNTQGGKFRSKVIHLLRKRWNIAAPYNNRGIAYYDKTDLDSALADFTQAIKLKPDFLDAYNNRGLTYKSKKDYDKAIADFNRAISIKPDSPDSYNNRGLAYSNKGDLDNALSDYNQAIKLKSDYAEAYNNRGIALADKGNLENAIADYSQAIKLKPNFAGSYQNRGNAYSKAGKFDNAIADFTQAIKLKSDFVEAFNARGLAYEAKKDHDNAISDYNQAIKIQPGFFNAYYNRGCAYKAKGNINSAIADFTQAIKIEPDYADAHKELHNLGVDK